MNIVHLTAGKLDEGAHLGALWLHQGLLANGIESTMVTSHPGLHRDASIIAPPPTRLAKLRGAVRRRLDRLAVLAYRRRNSSMFSTGFFGGRASRLKVVQNADVVHLHWIANDLISVFDLANIDRPIVWTLRDMWPFTGGCHLSMGCIRYQATCGQCPQLGSRHERDLSHAVLRAKQRFLPKHAVIVGTSQWMSGLARESSLFSTHRIETISNCIDTEAFRPMPRSVARELLGIGPDRQVILIGAAWLNLPWKGTPHAIDALHRLNRKSLLVVTFGRDDREAFRTYEGETMALGYLDDPLKMRIAYNAADVFLAPAIEEAFGKTLAESLSCGTPVVCFDAAGPKDIVEHLESGYRASPFELADLARGVQWVLAHPSPNVIRRRCRQRAVSLFSQHVVARQYEELYADLLAADQASGGIG